jgi:hypothetical protein
VAPRGFFQKDDVHGTGPIKVGPREPFVTDYVWHTDLLGHPSKTPGVITGFHIVEQPLIGGETDFICGNTVWDHLSEEQRIACENIVVEIDRSKFASHERELDYSGTIKLADVDPSPEMLSRTPLVYGPEPCVLVQPSFMHKIAGLSHESSTEWLKNFMRDHVMPHRISVQWRKGDIGVFCNRRFSHSSTPAERFMKYSESPNRLLLQTFLPTTKPMDFIAQPHLDSQALSRVGWVTSSEESAAASAAASKFAQKLGGRSTMKYSAFRTLEGPAETC